ncbi:hypothetical protein P152DRAFT_453624 [Eremomyces bilateralis CBS 781.70]|uniref:NAD(P)-binding protein n=1 Tax=Eremomyces bilateralis CBS 781.70 TaxID=1392243 RepID=A0A6G1GGH7_9PEZI|nr:uncharacterized protein P152DRAFT_453624 [Eremomyces bilateralis CBS 781.70]KAF1817011.1 hypothetical protein P152DRAFT_453624 [Eremomyces bilateralis CBS 781.70]
MVSLSVVESSNALVNTLHQNPVLVVFGGTSGIGRATLLEFAARTTDLSPRIHLVGRSASAADEIRSEISKSNPSATLSFYAADCGLMREVDRVCNEILEAEKEHGINVAYLAAGTLELDRKPNEEGLPVHLALQLFGRVRAAKKLLPALGSAAKRGELARLVFIAAGTKEGPIDEMDMSLLRTPISKIRGHLASMLTLVFAKLAREEEAKGVSFVHVFPGMVNTNILRNKRNLTEVAIHYVGSAAMKLASWMGKTLSIKETGERHVWLGTSAKFPPSNAVGFQGVQEDKKTEPATGVDGKAGSGAYMIDWDGSEANEGTKTLIANYIVDGMMDKVWEYFTEEFTRIGL